MPQTIEGIHWLSQQEIADLTGFSITKVRNVVQVLASVDQIIVRIDPRDGKSRLVRENDLDLIRKALNRGA
jgi:DNA-binding GntR family transcriptional regulator